MTWVNIIIQGILVGGLYALFAAGLSLIFGVMRLVNIAHGDLIVAVAFLAWAIIQKTGLHPLVSLCLRRAVGDGLWLYAAAARSQSHAGQGYSAAACW